MTAPPVPFAPDTVAVIFAATRCTGEDDGDRAAYDAAATEMDAPAAAQPGYRGVESARSPDGFGITVSYWENDAAARAWRDHPRHTAIREAGRARWYDDYRLTVAEVTRGYSWNRS